MSEEFKKSVNEVKEEKWQPIYKMDAKNNPIETDQEWTEICFVTNRASHKKSNPDYRYIAIREKMTVQQELDLGSFEQKQVELPFPTIELSKGKYKLLGLVTNRKIAGNEIINWY